MSSNVAEDWQYESRQPVYAVLKCNAMHKCGTSHRPVSVCLSVTLLYCIQMLKNILAAPSF